MSPYTFPGIDHGCVIQNIVCQAANVHNLKDNSQKQRIVKPRQIAMYFTRIRTRLSTAEIGRKYGKDHATVLHACKVVRDMIDSRDKEYMPLIRQVESQLAKVSISNYKTLTIKHT